MNNQVYPFAIKSDTFNKREGETSAHCPLLPIKTELISEKISEQKKTSARNERMLFARHFVTACFCASETVSANPKIKRETINERSGFIVYQN